MKCQLWFPFFPAGTSDFSSHRSAQSGYKVRSESHLVGNLAFFQIVKRPESESYFKSSFHAKTKNG